MTFEKCFLVGAATAAHQVEGNNTHNDCRAMEHMKNTSYAEPSLDAVDHYNRYEEDIKLLAAAGLNACRFSIEARKVIRQVAPHVKVGLTLSLHDIQAMPGGEELAGKEWAEEFTHYLPAIEEDDFLGVQNYTRTRIDANGTLPTPEGTELTQMEYEFYPDALENVIRAIHKDFARDLIVTENGIATAADSRRVEFIRRAMAGVKNCVDDGIPVKGYCHWSLLDNFEWQKGYSMTFGLIAVDRATQIRYPKKSLNVLGSFAK